VVDAVLGRLGRLAPTHQEAIEQLAVVPSALDRQLVDALVNDHSAITAAEARGLLTVQPSRVSFRHELTRRAIADALPVAQRLELNARVLAAMEELGIYDASRLVHHASEAGDVDALVLPDAALSENLLGLSFLSKLKRFELANGKMVLEQ